MSIKITLRYRKIRQGYLTITLGFCREIILAEILASRGQLMMYQIRQDLLQLKEETFAWHVVVRPHVELD